MRKIWVLTYFFVSIITIEAQCGRDINWLFGYNTMAHIGSKITFKKDNSAIDAVKMIENMSTYSAFISSIDNGELLIYSNGCRIFNNKYEVIGNGSGINDISAESLKDCYTVENLGHSGWMQDCLFIPCDDKDSCFLYIYKPRNVYKPNTPYVDKIALAKILRNPDGIYKVVKKDSVFYNKPNTSSGLNLLKKTNSNHWWLTSSTDSVNALLVFEVDGANIEFKKRQYFEDIPKNRDNN